MRTPIQRSTWVKPLLWLFGGTSEQSYVDVNGDELHVKFGYLFDEHIPIASISSIERTHWPIIGGLGWRTNLYNSIAVVGSYSNVVRLRFSPRVSMRLLRRMNVESLYVSVEDADAFVTDMRYRMEKLRA